MQVMIKQIKRAGSLQVGKISFIKVMMIHVKDLAVCYLLTVQKPTETAS